MKCPNCGVKTSGPFCSSCGTRIFEETLQSPAQTITKNPLNIKRGQIGFLTILILVVLIAALSSFSEPETNQTELSGLSDLMTITGTSLEEESNIKAVLSEVGINKIDSIVHDEMLDNMNIDGEKGFRVSSSDANNIILYLKPDKTVNMIRYADMDFYSNGTAHLNIKDYTMTLDERIDFKYSAEKIIKALLKAPSTADFPPITEYRFGKQDGIAIIQGYVDSQNSFGAMIRSEFQIKIRTTDSAVVSLIFDGKEYIQQ